MALPPDSMNRLSNDGVQFSCILVTIFTACSDCHAGSSLYPTGPLWRIMMKILAFCLSSIRVYGANWTSVSLMSHIDQLQRLGGEALGQRGRQDGLGGRFRLDLDSFL
jgi:hypothetical protein